MTLIVTKLVVISHVLDPDNWLEMPRHSIAFVSSWPFSYMAFTIAMVIVIYQSYVSIIFGSHCTAGQFWVLILSWVWVASAQCCTLYGGFHEWGFVYASVFLLLSFVTDVIQYFWISWFSGISAHFSFIWIKLLNWNVLAFFCVGSDQVMLLSIGWQGSS